MCETRCVLWVIYGTPYTIHTFFDLHFSIIAYAPMASSRTRYRRKVNWWYFLRYCSYFQTITNNDQYYIDHIPLVYTNSVQSTTVSRVHLCKRLWTHNNRRKSCYTKFCFHFKDIFSSDCHVWIIKLK